MRVRVGRRVGGDYTSSVRDMLGVIGPDSKLKRERKIFGWSQRILAALVLMFAALFIWGPNATAQEASVATSAAASSSSLPPIPIPGIPASIDGSDPGEADQYCSAVIFPSALNSIEDTTGNITKACNYVSRASMLPNVTSVSAACEYLTFCRWYGANMLPSPSLDLSNVGAQLLPFLAASLGTVLLAVASAIMYISGLIVVYSLSLSPIKSGLFFIDRMFASLGTRITGQAGDTTTKVGFLTVLFCIVAGLVIYQFIRHKGNWAEGVKTFVIAVFAVGLVGFMAYGAAQNHFTSVDSGAVTPGELSTVGQADAKKYQNGPPADAFTTPGGTGEDVGDWGVLSPGWLVTGFNRYVVGTATDITTGVTNDITSGAALNSPDSQTACAQYVGALHAAFLSTGTAKGMGSSAVTAVQYSELANKLYFNLYKIAAVGDVPSSNNAICRLLESQTGQSPQDQAMISRIAGLYSIYLGSGGLGVAGSTELGAVNGPANAFVASEKYDDTATAPGGGGTGPSYNADQQNGSDATVNIPSDAAGAVYLFDPGSNSKANRIASLFWAACSWGYDKNSGAFPVGGTLSPDWKGVQRSTEGSATGGGALTDADCNSYLSVGTSADTTYLWFVPLGTTDMPVMKRDAWSFQEFTAGCFFGVINPLGICGDDITDWSKFPQGSGAQQYYANLLGRNGFSAMVISFMVAGVAWMMAKVITPLALGSLFLQMIAILIFGALPLILIMFAFRNPRLRSISKGALFTILSALLVAVVLNILFSLMLAIASVFTSFVSALTGFSTSMMLKGIVTSGAVIGTFYVFKLLGKMLFGVNFSTMRSTFSSLGRWGTAPLAQSMGVNAIGPLDSEFWNSDSPGEGMMSKFRRRARDHFTAPPSGRGSPSKSDDQEAFGAALKDGKKDPSGNAALQQTGSGRGKGNVTPRKGSWKNLPANVARDAAKLASGAGSLANGAETGLKVLGVYAAGNAAGNRISNIASNSGLGQHYTDLRARGMTGAGALFATLAGRTPNSFADTGIIPAIPVDGPLEGSMVGAQGARTLMDSLAPVRPDSTMTPAQQSLLGFTTAAAGAAVGTKFAGMSGSRNVSAAQSSSWTTMPGLGGLTVPTSVSGTSAGATLEAFNLAALHAGSPVGRSEFTQRGLAGTNSLFMTRNSQNVERDAGIAGMLPGMAPGLVIPAGAGAQQDMRRVLAGQSPVNVSSLSDYGYFNSQGASTASMLDSAALPGWVNQRIGQQSSEGLINPATGFPFGAAVMAGVGAGVGTREVGEMTSFEAPSHAERQISDFDMRHDGQLWIPGGSQPSSTPGTGSDVPDRAIPLFSLYGLTGSTDPASQSVDVSELTDGDPGSFATGWAGAVTDHPYQPVPGQQGYWSGTDFDSMVSQMMGDQLSSQVEPDSGAPGYGWGSEAQEPEPEPHRWAEVLGVPTGDHVEMPTEFHSVVMDQQPPTLNARSLQFQENTMLGIIGRSDVDRPVWIPEDVWSGWTSARDWSRNLNPQIHQNVGEWPEQRIGQINDMYRAVQENFGFTPSVIADGLLAGVGLSNPQWGDPNEGHTVGNGNARVVSGAPSAEQMRSYDSMVEKLFGNASNRRQV